MTDHQIFIILGLLGCMSTFFIHCDTNRQIVDRILLLLLSLSLLWVGVK